MVKGIAGGLIMAGLLGGAITGLILPVLILSAAGFGIAAAASWREEKQATQAESRRRAAYPPYGY